MLRWLCNLLVRWLLPHSDYATAGYECRTLARAEIALAEAHLHEAQAFLTPLPLPVIRHLPEREAQPSQ